VNGVNRSLNIRTLPSLLVGKQEARNKDQALPSGAAADLAGDLLNLSENLTFQVGTDVLSQVIIETLTLLA
jgi:hypothetical protein